jgi:uncharacterized protein (DUF58 family)
MLTDELMREVRRLEIRAKRRVDDLFTGEYHSAFKGRGVEFAEVREYEPGDDVRTIDWNVTARMGKPFIKRYVEERELTVVLAADLSGSAGFGSVDRLKSRLIVEACAVLTLAAARNRDRVGLLLFTDRDELFLQPRKTTQPYALRVMRELLGFEPRGTGTNLAGAMESLGRVLRKRSIVFIISDFLVDDDAMAQASRPLRVLGRRHETILVRVSDPREERLPAVGLVTLEDPETGEQYLVDTRPGAARDAYAREASLQEQRLRATAAAAHADVISLSTDRPFVPEFLRYFRVRERRR